MEPDLRAEVGSPGNGADPRPPAGAAGTAGTASTDGMDDPRPLGPLAEDLASAALGLARRFHSGGTLWCVAPTWPEHARHVAVEFVHPVVMGARALPAASVAEVDTVAALRAVVRPGDAVAIIAPAAEPSAQAVARRAGAWGASTLWIGAGERPPNGAADWVLWLDENPAVASRKGRFVLMYHVLWELTQVCFEHPGLLAPTEEECSGPVCITCSDQGTLAEVVSVGTFGEVTVRTADGLQQTDATLVGPVEEGDLLLLHAGTAIEAIERATPRPVGVQS